MGGLWFAINIDYLINFEFLKTENGNIQTLRT